MNCPQCADKMVNAQATNFGETYQYCRTCKKELSEMSLPPLRRAVATIIECLEDFGVAPGRISTTYPNPVPTIIWTKGKSPCSSLVHVFDYGHSLGPRTNQVCICGQVVFTASGGAVMNPTSKPIATPTCTVTKQHPWSINTDCCLSCGMTSAGLHSGLYPGHVANFDPYNP